MSETVVMQGREIRAFEMALIRGLISQNAHWGRTRLSQELCRRWSWRAANGQLKDMACRTLLLKLDRAGEIELPAPRRPANNELRNRSVRRIDHPVDPIECKLQNLLPLGIHLVGRGDRDLDLFKCLLQGYHYLGHRSTVGETLSYLVRDGEGRPVSCLLFGAAAWAIKPRDEYIGWDRKQREQRLQWVTNNTRLLVLPWVRVRYLASHILSRICRRLRQDWSERYGHPISAVETFVDRTRFLGTCYQAANWRKVGQTSGRSRNGRRDEPLRSVKDVYLYSLAPQFRRELRGEAPSSNDKGLD